MLIMVAITLAPFHAMGGECASCCVPENAIPATGAAETDQDSCCTSDAAPGDQKNTPDEPCDGCECPMRCCTSMSKAPVNLPASPAVAIRVETHPVLLTGDTGDLADPHLLTLKRPPRA